MPKTIVITGGCGFIGSNLVRYMLKAHKDLKVINIDKLTYAGNRSNLKDVECDPRYRFMEADIADIDALLPVGSAIDGVIHLAAESHVDRSIMDASEFIRTNVVGTHHILEWARQHEIRRVVYVSTDEVYGSIPAGKHSREDDPLWPNSPYSASKASGDLLARAYHVTYGLPVVVTRCSNNYGPYQYPEKMIPLMISRAMHDEALPVYGDGLYIRDWLHVEDHCRAIGTVYEKGLAGQIYNISGKNEWKNIDVVRLILKHLKKPESLITYVTDRPGHDRRYALDASKIKAEIGWEPSIDFSSGLIQVIDWYLEHGVWVNDLKARLKSFNF
ncbi:MAG: dTDP-glucose 4,6-dehydratase [Candidatus Omnitrophota bacterium]